MREKEELLTKLSTTLCGNARKLDGVGARYIFPLREKYSVILKVPSPEIYREGVMFTLSDLTTHSGAASDVQAVGASQLKEAVLCKNK
jgi:hypothetical protein